ncbi:hypothetical protein HAZT_HAZT005288 [Hyalella azteca]|uniref:Endonuclease/exonuclease/phosphatase domain-containing protein n=1 Tax=Hyalella azteca TaxID=294128 RepID=A0A6A0H1T7_HYAAZ|nr:hypothetical protein HAZT_HAZT005288 [Hyalella azteca]
MVELAHFLVTHSVLVVAIQDSKLTEASNIPTFPGYTLVRRDKPIGPRTGDGGLFFIVNHTVLYSPIPSDHLFPGDSTTEHQAISKLFSISIDGAQFHLYNIYIPPPTSCPPGFSPSLSPLLKLDAHNTILMGDFNAHNPAWFSATQGDRAAARGAALINQIDSSQLILLNQVTPTRLP